MQRNFWFCAIDDPSGLDHRDRVGVDHVLLETDYPHQDGTWPDTQEILHAQIGHFPTDDIRKLTWENASRLFGHPVPEAVQPTRTRTEDRRAVDAHDIRFRIAAARRMLFRLGCDSNVGGHVSARADGEDAFWVTGFEYFDQTTPDRVAKLDFDLQIARR